MAEAMTTSKLLCTWYVAIIQDTIELLYHGKTSMARVLPATSLVACTGRLPPPFAYDRTDNARHHRLYWQVLDREPERRIAQQHSFPSISLFVALLEVPRHRSHE